MIFDDDREVQSYKRSLLLPNIPPVRAACIRTVCEHPAYKLVVGTCDNIERLYNGIVEKTFDVADVSASNDDYGYNHILVFDAYIHSNPILDFWRENSIMTNVCPFDWNDEDVQEWMDKYCELSPYELNEGLTLGFIPPKPEGFWNCYADLGNFVNMHIFDAINSYGNAHMHLVNVNDVCGSVKNTIQRKVRKMLFPHRVPNEISLLKHYE